MNTNTPAGNSATPPAVAIPEPLDVDTLSIARDNCVLLRATTKDEKIKERLWRAAGEFEAARKILAAALRKAAKGGATQ